MNEQIESKSLGRLIANLESDPDIQAAIEAKQAAQGLAVEDPGVEAFRRRAFQIVREARACYEEQNKSFAPAEWLREALKELGERADRFCKGFGSRVVELIQIPDSGFVRTAPVLSHASGETLPTKTVRLNDFVPDAVLKEHLPWAGDFLRVTATKVEPTSTDNAFRVAVDFREETQGAKGELAIGVKFKSECEFVVLSPNQPNAALLYQGSDQLEELSIQVFVSTGL
jgi:hypothetical protein